jgi:sugar lactone lactonase YvrE
VGAKLYIVDLSKGPNSLRTIDTRISIGVTADIEGSDEVILAGAKDGITKFNVNSARHEYVAKFWNEDDGPDKAKEYVFEQKIKSLYSCTCRMRSNDGAADSEGRFWVGTMNDPFVKEPTDEGVLFRLDTDGTLHRMIEKGPAIPNGISWNEKNDTMFLTDSPENNILAFDFDAATGNISNKRVFFHNQEDSHIDGHVRDVEDCIWHACYAGSKIIRISPEGKVIGEISFPTRNITCPAFVGTELYVTSAAEEEPDKYPESAKFAGNLFRVDVGIKGRPRHKARFPNHD